MSHALRRTSPKGPEQKFVGVCTKCGMEGLTFEDMGKHCPNPADFSDDDALIRAIKEPRDEQG